MGENVYDLNLMIGGKSVYVDSYLDDDKVLVGRKSDSNGFIIVSEKISNKLVILKRDKTIDDLLNKDEIIQEKLWEKIKREQ